MQDPSSDEQARIYLERAEAYETLIAAEDADHGLLDAITRRVSLVNARVADVGAGTGRLARMIAPHAAHVHLIDRAAPMLEVARRELARAGLADRTTIHEADARALPLESESVDVATAGWVFGHFRHWMPDGWRDEVDAAVREMRRVVRPGGHLLILETLGTGHATPRAHPALDEYFAHLEHEHHFERSWLRTDYVFASVEAAATVLGAFFGAALVSQIREQQWTRVPECTALFVARR